MKNLNYYITKLTPIMIILMGNNDVVLKLQTRLPVTTVQSYKNFET